MGIKVKLFGTLAILVIAILAVCIKGSYDGDSGENLSNLPTLLTTEAVAQTAGSKTQYPVGREPVAIKDGKYPDSYFPNTELLGADEMRITALGTGMPNVTRNQASISYLVELGNGDKFLFDLGGGSFTNLMALRPDFQKVDTVFASHLHTDHIGDFPLLLVGGWISGRYTPLHIYGPSGDTPELGTKAFADAQVKAWAWDIKGRSGALPDAGGKVEVQEFDYKGDYQVVYDQNGVIIRSWPAIHVLDGAVSYSLEWNGLKFVFGGDTYPNKWYIKYAKGADVASHELFAPPEVLAKQFGWDMRQATWVGTRIHTGPQAFGKVMSAVKPRLAVGYHSTITPTTVVSINDGVRETYDGPLAIAQDLMVINVTKNQIVVRQVAVDDNAYPPGASPEYKAAKRSGEAKVSEFIDAGKWKGYKPPPMPKE